MVTVGLLYPGHSAEDDHHPALEARLDGAVRLPVVITHAPDLQSPRPGCASTP